MVCALPIEWPNQFLDELITHGKQRETVRSAVKEQKVLNGIEAHTAVVNAGGDLWRSVKEWGASRRLLSPTEAGILDVAASVPLRLPSEKQSIRVLGILKKLHAEGCQIGLGIHLR